MTRDAKEIYVLTEVQTHGVVSIPRAVQAFALSVDYQQAVDQYQRAQVRRHIKRTLRRLGVASYCDGRGNVVPISTLQQARENLVRQLARIQGRTDQYTEALSLFDYYKSLQPRRKRGGLLPAAQLHFRLDPPGPPL